VESVGDKVGKGRGGCTGVTDSGDAGAVEQRSDEAGADERGLLMPVVGVGAGGGTRRGSGRRGASLRGLAGRRGRGGVGAGRRDRSRGSGSHGWES
jgi:hypothetical protein